MISAAQDLNIKAQLIANLLQYSNQQLQKILGDANQNMNTLMIPDTIKQIDYVIKINSKVVESAGAAYISYL